jgi:hypothetical protein
VDGDRTRAGASTQSRSEVAASSFLLSRPAPLLVGAEVFSGVPCARPPHVNPYGVWDGDMFAQSINNHFPRACYITEVSMYKTCNLDVYDLY